MGDLRLHGPSLTLRYADPADAPALFALGSDPEVTRFFSWGPYERIEQAEGYIGELPGKRERGEALDFLIVDREGGPIGVTGLNELSRRDRRAVVGTWFGRSWWGTGSNHESKALMFHLAFEVLGLDRVSAYAAVENARSQRALEKIGFRREGVLHWWHRHGERRYDLAIYGYLRPDWVGSGLRGTPVQAEGDPPAEWVV